VAVTNAVIASASEAIKKPLEKTGLLRRFAAPNDDSNLKEATMRVLLAAAIAGSLALWAGSAKAADEMTIAVFAKHLTNPRL
jgi:hypothetical protein